MSGSSFAVSHFCVRRCHPLSFWNSSSTRSRVKKSHRLSRWVKCRHHYGSGGLLKIAVDHVDPEGAGFAPTARRIRNRILVDKSQVVLVEKIADSYCQTSTANAADALRFLPQLPQDCRTQYMGRTIAPCSAPYQTLSGESFLSLTPSSPHAFAQDGARPPAHDSLSGKTRGRFSPSPMGFEAYALTTCSSWKRRKCAVRSMRQCGRNRRGRCAPLPS